MKTWKKILRCIIALLFIAGIVSALRFTSHQKNNNSDLDMETANQEIQENQETQDVQEAPAYPVIQPENWFEIMWPENWFDEQLEAWQLVLRWEYEDHTDVIFIDQEMWQNYIDPHKMIYWDDVSFKWEVEQIDWAAWTHYYKAVSIDTLEELFLTSTLEWENSLVIVFSPTGHTKQIATYISEIIDCELNEIWPENPYTEEDLNWRNEQSRSYQEYQDLSIRPEFGNDFNLDQYDTIYLWFPIWFGRTPNIIFTLLEKYDFSDKNIVLFCTSWSSWIEGSFEYLEPYNLNIIWSKRFAQGASKQEVQEWLESL